MTTVIQIALNLLIGVPLGCFIAWNLIKMQAENQQQAGVILALTEVNHDVATERDQAQSQVAALVSFIQSGMSLSGDHPIVLKFLSVDGGYPESLQIDTKATAEAYNARILAESTVRIAELQAENQQQAGVILAFREAVLAYAPHKETESAKLDYIRFMSTYYTDPMRHGDANNGLLQRLYPLLADTTEAAKKARDSIRNEAVEACMEVVGNNTHCDAWGAHFDCEPQDLIEAVEALKTQEGK